MSGYSDDFDDFSTQIQSDEMIPEFYEDIEGYYYDSDAVSRAHDLAYGDEEDAIGDEDESDVVDGDWRDAEDWDDDWSDEDASDDLDESDDEW